EADPRVPERLCGASAIRDQRTAVLYLDRPRPTRAERRPSERDHLMRSPRRLLLLAAASAAVLITAAPALAQTQVAPSDPWIQATSDIPADANVRFGILPNGMQYAIMRNATPPGQASLRLRIDAGSLMENENQLGLAHFLEHMAFNGTTNIPENDQIGRASCRGRG